jgi:tRNA A-37 threonylcarbamoyl transferase component Bud32
MRTARSHGFPAPDVIDVRHDGLALERIDGPTLHKRASAANGDLTRIARELADLHPPTCDQAPSIGHGAR